MVLTPVDVLHTQFKTAIRGYNKHQVDEFVRSVRESLEELIKEKTDIQRRFECLEQELERLHKIESTMSKALTLAQKTADEIRANAHKEAEAIIKEAEQARVQMTVDAQKEIERLRAEIDLLRSTRDRCESEFRAALTNYLEWLDKRKQMPELPNEVVAKTEAA